MIAISDILNCENAEDLKDKVDALKQFISIPRSDVCFARDLIDLCSSLASKARIYPDVEKECILPLVRLFLQDSNLEDCQTAQSSIVVLVDQGILSKECVENYFCDTFVDLLNSSTKDEFRIETINNLSKILHYVDKEVIINKILPTFINLCKDTSVDVKRACVSCFGKFANLIGPESTETYILPLYESMSKEGLPEVRKACVDISVTLSYLCSNKVRNEVLAPLFIKFLTDDARYVMDCALITMGPFIATFADSHKTGLYYVGNGVVASNVSNNASDECNKQQSDPSDHSSGSGDSGCVLSASQSEASDASLDHLFPGLSLQDNCHANQPTQNLDAMYNQLKQQKMMENNSAVETEPDEHLTSSRSDNTDNGLKDEDLSFSFEDYTDEINRMISESVSLVSEQHPPTDAFEDDGLKAEFNHFLYWREPLPSIDHELQNDISNGQVNPAFEENTKSNCLDRVFYTTDPSLQANESSCSYLDDNGKICFEPKEGGLSKLLNFSDNSIFSNTQPKKNCSIDLLALTNFTSQNGIIEQDQFVHYPDLYMQQQLGTIEQDIVPNELLEHFLRMTTTNYLSNFYNTDITYHCAYSLPAVAFTLGRENWPCLRRTFSNLVINMPTNIRCILSASLYSIAFIIGPEHTSRDLFPALLIFMADTDEVRLRILTNFSSIVKLLNKDEQVTILSKLNRFIDLENSLNWRFRLMFAQHLSEIVTLYNRPTYFNEYILPIVCKLLQDKVAEVRKAGVQVLAFVVRHLHDTKIFHCEESNELTRKLFAILRDVLAKSDKWVSRQTFVLFCEKLVVDSYLPLSVFSIELLEPLLGLTCDKVPNVRLALSRLISNLSYSVNAELIEQDAFREAIAILRDDKDSDVKSFLAVPKQFTLFDDSLPQQSSFECNTNISIDRYVGHDDGQKMESVNCSVEHKEHEEEQNTIASQQQLANKDQCSPNVGSFESDGDVKMEFNEMWLDSTAQVLVSNASETVNSMVEMDTNDLSSILNQPTILAEPMKAMLVLEQSSEEQTADSCRILRQFDQKSMQGNREQEMLHKID